MIRKCDNQEDKRMVEIFSGEISLGQYEVQVILGKLCRLQ